MANNELFYRVAREALAAENDIQELVDDLDAAIESYLTGACEEAESNDRVRSEVRHGYQHALALADNLRAWHTSTYDNQRTEDER